MAPIILRIKGPKLFSPFNDVNSANDLSAIWRVCTKVKDSLENGSRLENLSWRLWYLQQVLEGQGRGNQLCKLIPKTEQDIESSDKQQVFGKRRCRDTGKGGDNLRNDKNRMECDEKTMFGFEGDSGNTRSNFTNPKKSNFQIKVRLGSKPKYDEQLNN
ncbi:hypothetical protein AX774_g1745 [Zancudomyces culisetae]|uniref:Nitrogen regulatory protein areA GATA-like domain-containing protein n=1 Tax=Zancudomyces culisetae TaxID=1213189 RepID=A0A1R1PUS4_ZANCU|nr:hypothetical protein AX774_g1745 [Zancudomyces culisetae]|eukprot:OMH84721.1 hypothetical protein AX774_g1745 [Zancudomyces culisetae]